MQVKKINNQKKKRGTIYLLLDDSRSDSPALRVHFSQGSTVPEGERRNRTGP